MLVNVAQLLKEPVGSTRRYSVNEDITDANSTNKQNIRGEITIIRIDKGILVDGNLSTVRHGNCARCLIPVDYRYEFEVEEEFVPTIDINTDQTIEVQDDVFKIDTHHNINLSDLFSQYALMAIPMKTLCRDDCAGICPVCGQNLNKGKCNCVIDNSDIRWSKLKNLKKEGKD
jgi:uncharacterized protein